MKHLFRVALLGMLVLPFGRVFAAANPSLVIDISVSIDSAVTLQWADATTAARTWTIGAANLATDYNTLSLIGNGNVFDVKNISQVPVTITIGVTNQGNWILKTMTGFPSAIDQFWIRVSKNNTDFSMGIELPETGTTALVSAPGGLAKDATQTVDLQFHTPTSVSQSSGGTIKVTMTGSAL
ncbi:MAG: hypothetical protein V1899_05455 [Planctomycetota bacterium]